MSTPDEIWTTRLHAAVDDHPGALAFDVPSYVAAGRKRARRNRATALVAAAAAVAAVAGVTAVVAVGARGGAPQPSGPVVPHLPTLGPATNGWVAVDANQGGGDIYLVRPGEGARRLQVPGADAASEACPAWSPDGSRLLFGRVTGSSDITSGDAQLVIVPVNQDGAAGTPTVIGLEGFGVLDGFDPHPCGAWAPDGRWVALRGPGEVWVVDTHTGAIRRLPDLRPIDLEWRPGTDELAMAGDMGMTRAAEWVSTPVTVYSVSSGETRQLGSVAAGGITWSPDGSSLAFEGGEDNRAGLRVADADGTNERVLAAGYSPAVHGIGPVWSPTGDRIAYQRRYAGSAEGSEVVLVRVADGTQTVIEPPKTGGPDGPHWYPYSVSWSPDGTTLVYTGWTDDGDGVIAVPADAPSDVTVLTDLDSVPGYAERRWVRIQMWGRQPGR